MSCSERRRNYAEQVQRNACRAAGSSRHSSGLGIVPQRVRGCRFDDACIAHGLAHRALECLVAEVVSPRLSRTLVDRERRRRKHVLPAPFPRCIRIFARERVRQMDGATACRDVAIVDRADFAQVRKQRAPDAARQHRHAIFRAFSIAYDDFPAREVDIADPQPHALHDPQTCAVQKIADQVMNAAESLENLLNLRTR